MKLVQNNFITKNTSLNIFAYASLTVWNNNGTFLPNERETMGCYLYKFEQAAGVVFNPIFEVK